MFGPALRSRLSARGLPMASAPAALLAVVAVIDVLGVGWSGAALTQLDADPRAWVKLVLLCVLAIGFEEGARRAARLQIRLSPNLRADMTSVWIVTAAVALSPGRAVIMLAALFTYIWFRQQRPAGEHLYRKFFTSNTALVACLAAGGLSRSCADWSSGMPWALNGSLPVLAAVGATAVVARVLTTPAALALGMRGRTLLGSRHDNLIELATLCLGGLVALAVVHEPLLAVLVIAPMVTLQRGALVRELETAAMTDAKTGLLNAVAWEQLAQREIIRATREKNAVGILIIDIDRFKTVNDRFGHLVGDEVLLGIGKAIKAALREYDGLGRFGGEEFVAVLPDADDHGALVIAERIRSRINQICVGDMVAGDLPGSREGLLSVSIGVACLPIDGAELPDLLHSADQALYRAKANGRNRVLLARRGGETTDRVSA